MKQEPYKNKLPAWFIVLAAISGLVVLLAPLWLDINGHDNLYHRNWIGQFTEQFRNGNLYPRWMADSFSGFGSPVFYFYPPFSYHVASVISLFGITNEIVLYKIVAYIFLILSFFTCRAYLRRLTPNTLAVTLGAFIYAFAPYRIIDLYIRSAWSEYVALTWVPLIFLVAENILTQHSRSQTITNTIYLAGLIALTIMTNIPTAIMIIPATLVYMLASGKVSQYGKVIGISVVASVLGFLFAGMFTFPLYAFREYMNDASLWQFFSTHVGYALTVGFTPSNRIFGLSILAVLLMALWILIVLIRNRNGSEGPDERKRIVPLIIVIAAGIFMQIPGISEPVYHIPPLRYIQFAYRWDVVLTLAFSAAIALLLNRTRTTTLILSAAMLAGLVVIIGAVTLRYSERVASEKVRLLERDDPAEYLSVTSKRHPLLLESYYRHKSEFDVDIVEGFRAAKLTIIRVDKTPELHRYTVSAQDTGTVAINLNHFPTWEVYRNNTPIASTGDEYGRRLIPITKGDYEVTVVRHTSAAEQYGLVATGIGLLSVLIAYISGRKKSRGSSQT